MKSIDLATWGSRLSVGKLTNTCLLNRKEGIVQKLMKYKSLVFIRKSSVNTHVFADLVCLNTEVSTKALQRNIDATRGFLLVLSANFWAKNPPSDAPNMCTCKQIICTLHIRY